MRISVWSSDVCSSGLRANRYPGVAVDIPSLVYSFSYEQRGSWSRLFAPGSELLAYAEDVVDRRNLRRRMRFGTSVTSMTFHEPTDLWHVAIEDADRPPENPPPSATNPVGALSSPP